MDNATTPDLDSFLGMDRKPAWRRTLDKPWVKWPLILVGLVLLGILAMQAMQSEQGPQYTTADVRQGDFQVTVSATGKLAPTNQVTVGSQLSGLVTQVVVDVNDRVTAGQALALIDPEQLDDQIKQSQAQLAANQAQVEQARATLTESLATLARFEEVSRLSQGRVPAKTELDTARATVARSRASLRVAEANVVSARAQLSSNQTQRERAIIRSPVNGVVLARQVDPGQTVAASFNTPTLFVIAEDLAAMKLEVAIDEADVGAVKEGQRATFTVDAFPGERFPAAITRVDVGSNLSAQEAASGTTSTTTTANQVVSYAAVLSVANARQRLRPGMTATAEIVTNAASNVLLVPNAALRFTPQAEGQETAAQAGGGVAGALVPRGRRGGQRAEKSATIRRGAQQTVYILGEDGQPQPVQITTGDTNGQMTQVTGGGLRPGMKVIVGQLASGQGATAKGGGQRASGQRKGGGGQGGQ